MTSVERPDTTRKLLAGALGSGDATCPEPVPERHPSMFSGADQQVVFSIRRSEPFDVAPRVVDRWTPAWLAHSMRLAATETIDNRGLRGHNKGMTTTTTRPAIGTCRYGHTTRTAVAGIHDCPACNADPAILAERAAFLAQHPRGIFNLTVKTSGIRGRVSKSHECNGECTEARGDKCICSCGGANHGAGWVA